MRPVQLDRSSSLERDGNISYEHTSVPSEGNHTSTDQLAKEVALASLKTTSASSPPKQMTSALDGDDARGKSAEVHSFTEEDDLQPFSHLPTPPCTPENNQLSAEKLEQVSPLDEAIKRMEQDFLQKFPEAIKKATLQSKERLELPPRAHLSDSFYRRVPLATVSTNTRNIQVDPMLGQEDGPIDTLNIIRVEPQPLFSEAEQGAPLDLKGISTWHPAYRTSYVQELQTAADRIWPRTSIRRDSGSSWSLRERHCSKSEPAYDQLH